MYKRDGSSRGLRHSQNSLDSNAAGTKPTHLGPFHRLAGTSKPADGLDGEGRRHGWRPASPDEVVQEDAGNDGANKFAG